MSDATKVKCPTCKGSGQVLNKVGREHAYWSECVNCAGTGKVVYAVFVAITGRD